MALSYHSHTQHRALHDTYASLIVWSKKHISQKNWSTFCWCFKLARLGWQFYFNYALIQHSLPPWVLTVFYWVQATQKSSSDEVNMCLEMWDKVMAI